MSHHRTFADRHIGPDEADQARMLAAVGYPSLDALVDAVVPGSIRDESGSQLPPAASEVEVRTGRCDTFAECGKQLRSDILNGRQALSGATVGAAALSFAAALAVALGLWPRLSEYR